MDTKRGRRDLNYSPFSTDSIITQIIMLNLLDALLTMYAIRLGVEELNPLMDYLLSVGPITFFSVKVVLVTALIYLVNRFAGSRGRHLYTAFLVLYWLLTLWHIYGAISIFGM